MACILVIEDDVALAAFLVDVLEDEGYQVVVATTGEAALALLTTLHPQLIICDMVLTDTDGISVCQAMQANPVTAAIPILICSAVKEAQIQNQCSYSAFLAKPFDLTDLLRLVAMLQRPPTGDAVY